MAHQLGGQYDLPHGVCNAVLLPVVEEFNAEVSHAVPPGYVILTTPWTALELFSSFVCRSAAVDGL